LKGFRLEIFDERESYIYNDLFSINIGTVIKLPIPCGTIRDRVEISLPGKIEALHLREAEINGD